MANPSERAQLLEGLLGDGVFALEALLTSPDVHLDCLEQATHDAIEVARETVHVVKAALDGRTCVSHQPLRLLTRSAGKEVNMKHKDRRRIRTNALQGRAWAFSTISSASRIVHR